MMFKENNGNAFIMKCFQVMSSDNLNSTSRSLITGFPWKMLYDWPLKVGLALLYPPLLVMDNYGGCEPNPMVEDMYYYMISRIPGIVGNVGYLAQWC